MFIEFEENEITHGYAQYNYFSLEKPWLEPRLGARASLFDVQSKSEKEDQGGRA